MTKSENALELTAERLHEVLNYNPETGLFTWRVCMGNRAMAGAVAGTPHANGCIHITVDRQIYKAHRLAWFYMTGEWPTAEVDHRDMNGSNNRWLNLRMATKSQNMANRGTQTNTSSGLKGAYRYKAGERYGKPWQAGIQVDGKKLHLGHFATAEEAHAAYCVAAKKYFGEFARAA